MRNQLTGRAEVVQHFIRPDLCIDGFDCGCHLDLEKRMKDGEGVSSRAFGV